MTTAEGIEKIKRGLTLPSLEPLSGRCGAGVVIVVTNDDRSSDEQMFFLRCGQAASV
jgi:hypothetical protein